MGAVTMRLSIAGLVLAGLVLSLPASSASAQPPAEPPAQPAADPAALRLPEPPPAAPAPPPADGAITVEKVISAAEKDPALAEGLKTWMYRVHADELAEISRKRHDEDSAQIALNKKHVILAYAALWLLAVVFLVVQWRRQQALSERISQLHKELEAATREGAR
jgi:hypothetical protein